MTKRDQTIETLAREGRIFSLVCAALIGLTIAAFAVVIASGAGQ
jgi:hypothetical protein